MFEGNKEGARGKQNWQREERREEGRRRERAVDDQIGKQWGQKEKNTDHKLLKEFY